MTKILEIKRWWGAKWGGLLQGTTWVGSIFKIANNAVIGTVGVQTIIDNTQTSAQIAQKIDLGTSAQGHTGVLVTMWNASTLARGIKIIPWWTWAWIWIEGHYSWGFKGLYFATLSNANNNTAYWIYQEVLNTAWTYGWGHAYWIYQAWINNHYNHTCYGLYQASINQNWSGMGYGIFQNVISTWPWVSPWVWYYIGNLHNSNNWVNAKFISWNNNQSQTLVNRVLAMSEILVSRNSTRTSWATDDTHDQTHFRRTSIQSWAGGIFNSGWSVLKLENIATQTAGTLNDTVTPLSLLNQSWVSNGGHMKFNAYTPLSEANVPNNTMWWTGTDLKIKDNAWVVKTATLT